MFTETHTCPRPWADRAKSIPRWQRLLMHCLPRGINGGRHGHYRQILRSSAALHFVISLDTGETGNLSDWWVSATCAERMAVLHVVLDWDAYLRGLVAESGNARGIVRGASLIPAALPHEPRFHVAEVRNRDLRSAAGELAGRLRSLGPGTVVPFYWSGDYLFMNAGWTFDLTRELDSKVFDSGLWLAPESVFGESTFLKVLTA